MFSSGPSGSGPGSIGSGHNSYQEGLRKISKFSNRTTKLSVITVSEEMPSVTSVNQTIMEDVEEEPDQEHALDQDQINVQISSFNNIPMQHLTVKNLNKNDDDSISEADTIVTTLDDVDVPERRGSKLPVSMNPRISSFSSSSKIPNSNAQKQKEKTSKKFHTKFSKISNNLGKATQKISKKFIKSQEEITAAKTLSLMVGAFSICIIPATIVMIIELADPPSIKPGEFDPKEYSKFFGLEVAFTVVLMCNGICNFLVYSLYSREFRRDCLKLFGRK